MLVDLFCIYIGQNAKEKSRMIGITLHHTKYTSNNIILQYYHYFVTTLENMFQLCNFISVESSVYFMIYFHSGNTIYWFYEDDLHTKPMSAATVCLYRRTVVGTQYIDAI